MTGISAQALSEIGPENQGELQEHGPKFLDNGQVLFQLWAPTAKTVELMLNDGEPQSMRIHKGGWYSLTTQANGNDRYRFRINGEILVPDPASRYQPEGPNGPSQLVAPMEIIPWHGRPWSDAVIYELHVGTFTSEGTYKGAQEKLSYLRDLGITAIELMPLSAFEGRHGWGYDGVLPYAPHAGYGTPEQLRDFIEAAHGHGIMVFLDVVYNHFGPSGNYLNDYAKTFFNEERHTPWGAAIDFENERPVREYFIENALYWINDYGFDGLRFDAVHTIEDSGSKHFVKELGEEIRTRLPHYRHVHLILENEKNEARYLERDDKERTTEFTAQWNDDFHHALHILLTGETGGYYVDYEQDPTYYLGRALSEGFSYQGEKSKLRKGERRGEPSAHLPPSAFVAFLQNHDQIGNRPMGERFAALASTEKLKLGFAILMLNPAPPMLYMGEEWGSTTPFLYFCDFSGELADAVREGRRKEFSAFPEFADPEAQDRIPDPTSEETVVRSTLDWTEQSKNKDIFDFVKTLIGLRHAHITPLLATGWRGSEMRRHGKHDLEVRWHFGNGRVLQMLANFSDKPMSDLIPISGARLWGAEGGTIAPWTCRFTLGMGGDGQH